MTATIRQCAILAGGLATRLGAISATTPKPVLDVAGRPFLFWLMRELQRFGVDEFLLLTGHLSQAVEQAVRTAAAALPRPSALRFSIEPTPAGTGGALHHARDMLDARFLLCNGDSLLDANLADLLRDAAAAGTERLGQMLTRSVDDASRYGVVAVQGGRVTSFAERPQPGAPGTINAGVYLLDRAVLRRIAPQCSLERDVLPDLATEGRLGATATAGWFIDIGIPADLTRAREQLPARLSRAALFLDCDCLLRGRVSTGEQLNFVPGALAAVRRATAAGWHVFLVANSSMDTRGSSREAPTPEILASAADATRREGGTIDDTCYRPRHHHHTDAGDDRSEGETRNATALMLRELIGRWQLLPRRCLFVSGTASDVNAVAAAGACGRLFPGDNLDAFVSPLLAASSVAAAFGSTIADG